MQKFKEKGFTVAELLIVIGIITVLIGVSTSLYFSIRKSKNIDVEAEKITSALRLQQNKTLSGGDFDSHGVYFDSSTNTYTLFVGTTYNASDPSNQTEPIEGRVFLNNIQLTGGGNSIVFDRLSGRTANSGYIEIAYKADPSDVRHICIKKSGSVHTLDISETSSCLVADLEYTGGTTDSDLATFPSDSAWGDPAQSFTTGIDAMSVSGVDLYLRYDDDDLEGDYSDIFLEIREDSTTGNVIGKSLILDGGSLPSSLSWEQFIFPTPVQLSASTQYFLRLRSLPDSTIPSSGGEGTIIWGYMQSTPSGYAGGSSWRYVGANNNPSDTGQQLSDSDYSFKIYTEDSPNFTDSRHLEFDLEFDLKDYTNIILDFNSGAHIENIVIADNTMGDIFTWESDIDVSGNTEHIKLHSIYMDENDTVLSVHRGLETNDIPLDINIDTVDLVDYSGAGVPTKGVNIGSMIYR